MSEKIKNINESVKGVCKKVFTKRNITVVIAILVVFSALKIGYSLMFEVEGVVRKVTTNSITVANFFNTKTIKTGDYKIDTSKITVGDRVEVSKNLSGQVLDIRVHGEKNDENYKNEKNKDQRNNDEKNNDERNDYEGNGKGHFGRRH